MKIALINFTYNKKSGIEKVADNTIRQLDKLDKENEYLLFLNESAHDYYISSSKIVKKIIPMASKQILKTFWLLFVYPVYSLITGIDITIIYNCSSNFALSPFTKNIIYIHDLGELIVTDKYDIKRMIYRKYLSLPINKMLGNIFIAVSKSTQQEVVEKLKIDEHKVKLIYNGTDEDIKKLDKNLARNRILEKYSINHSDRIIVVIGRIDPLGKNLFKLIEAVTILRRTEKDFHVFLVGESNFPKSHLVPEEIEKHNLKDYVTFTGYVDDDELNLFYNASDLLVFPSIYEGFGLPLLEAMKCELPVACSDIDVFHEVGGDAAIYFDPYNPDDMAEKMAGGLNDVSLRERLVEEGRQRILMFTWKNSATKLLELFR